MNADALKQEIRGAALSFALKRNLLIDDSHRSAVILRNVADNFHPESFRNIVNHPEWLQRTLKRREGVLVMQSSNSSDALLMNIICHPDIRRWKGVSNVLCEQLEAITLGLHAMVRMSGGSADQTEIDLSFGEVFCEAKLTEADFTKKRADVVERYDEFHTIFHAEALSHIGEDYDNYQIIRNLLAAIQHGRKHMLLCDERRPDLLLRYMQTVSCLREMPARKRCRVVFWQKLVGACGASLRDWIEEKYGMR